MRNKIVLYLTLVFVIVMIATFNLLYLKKNHEINKYDHSKYSINAAPVDHEIKLTKKIWQTAQKSRHKEIDEYMNSWKDIPGWKHNFVENSDAVEYVKEKHPELDIDKIANDIQVMAYDIWRYSKIYHEGGLYADSDVEKADEFEESMSRLSGCGVIIGVEADTRHKGDWWINRLARQFQFCQWSLYAAPKHPLMHFVVERIIQRLRYRLDRKEKLSRDEVMDLTGPGVWTDAIKEYLKLAVGVDVDKEMRCGQSYKYNDICIINAYALGGPSAVSCDHDTKKEDTFVLSNHHFWGSWKSD